MLLPVTDTLTCGIFLQILDEILHIANNDAAVSFNYVIHLNDNEYIIIPMVCTLRCRILDSLDLHCRIQFKLIFV
jgi:hypothetical protein